jgi:DNA-binding CsgD family transcriptional regulator
MLQLQYFDRVVSQIYEAALVPDHWEIALASMMESFAPRQWTMGLIVRERLGSPAGHFIGSAGVEPIARDSYLAYFSGRQEWSRRGHDLTPGQVVLSDDLIAREEFRETDFYKRFLDPWGLEVALVGLVDRQGSDHVGILCPGPADVNVDLLTEAVRRLMPHMQRAARISARIGAADMRADTATETLNASPYSVIALGADMELLMANNMGQALLDQGGGVSVKHGRLRIDDAVTTRTLADMAASSGKDHMISFTATGNDGAPLVMTALAVSKTRGDQFADPAGGAALMLVGGQRIDITDSLLESLQQSFHLTRAEARLAGFLVHGSGVRGYAADRGVSLEAGKYLLKGVYAKTGINNQTELVALLRAAPLGWGKALPGVWG